MLEVKEEIIDDETLFVKNSYNSGDEKNNTGVDDIDIVQHNIETVTYKFMIFCFIRQLC